MLVPRERKKSEVMAQRRQQGPPPVVAFLPLSTEVDFPTLWRLVLGAFAAAPAGKPAQLSKKKGGVEDMDADEAPAAGEMSQSFRLLSELETEFRQFSAGWSAESKESADFA